MKFKFNILLIFGINFLMAQQTNIGYVVEYNLPINVEYTVYSPPLRINKVETMEEIDYSKIEGLLQSYLSASNMEWVRNEYLLDSVLIGRDQEHFDAVKKATSEDYIQIEATYKFGLEDKKMAYVKYSFIFEKLPFPFIAVLSMEYVNERWYLSNILNQGAVYELLGKFKVPFLKDFFTGKSSTETWDSIIQNSKNRNNLPEITMLFNNLEKLKISNNNLYKEVRDERLISQDVNFRNAKLNSKQEKKSFKLSHPFIYDNIRFQKYKSNEADLVRNEETEEKYSNSPELTLLSNIPIQLLNKVIVFKENKEYHVIKYVKNNAKEVDVVSLNNGIYSIKNGEEIENINELVLICKPDFLENILQDDIQEMSDFIKGSDGGINIDLVLAYINENRSSLNSFLDE
ncbi:hypothetical protein SB49_14940 [Sediminicola sp. YIK13]|uniref:hypothetical protein n=1 Tax=Sediminicola sp. YIK13 TaxID=1453352 RepID=UPI000720EB4E|nr:hypothetical protein [Sediminicola sp. YIK13]ALM08945.1 hypothetical protein SB49_14940 [Sediminicola sp. YIK13]